MGWLQVGTKHCHEICLTSIMSFLDVYRGIPLWNDVNNEELYDLTSEGGVNVNVVDEESYADVIEDLNQRLQAGWRASLPMSPE